jgi:hypothetical protein
MQRSLHVMPVFWLSNAHSSDPLCPVIKTVLNMNYFTQVKVLTHLIYYSLVMTHILCVCVCVCVCSWYVTNWKCSCQASNTTTKAVSFMACSCIMNLSLHYVTISHVISVTEKVRLLASRRIISGSKVCSFFWYWLDCLELFVFLIFTSHRL